jgi:hypothetical protein
MPKPHKRVSVLKPEPTNGGMRTLWSATLQIADGREDFLFREQDDFEKAAATAQKLVEGSTACRMVGAVIVEIKRVAHLWN